MMVLCDDLNVQSKNGSIIGNLIPLIDFPPITQLQFTPSFVPILLPVIILLESDETLNRTSKRGKKNHIIGVCSRLGLQERGKLFSQKMQTEKNLPLVYKSPPACPVGSKSVASLNPSRPLPRDSPSPSRANRPPGSRLDGGSRSYGRETR